MAQPSRLDQTPNINARFNDAGDPDRLAKYQLTPAEHEKLSDLRQSLQDKTTQEKENFSKPQELERRVKDKYAELAQRNNVPTPEHFPPGARNRTLPQHQLMSIANVTVRQDHVKTLNGYQNDYRSGVNDVLNKAAEQGRGPNPQQQQQRDQTQDRTAKPQQDFNRAAEQARQQQSQPSQDFNRSANDNRDRDRDR